jgi:hypothetical protein
LQDGHFVGSILYVATDAANANTDISGEWRRIQAYDASTGRFTLDRNTAEAITASDSLEIHPVIHPTLINQAIDRALRKMLYPTLALPSLLADADMEASGTSSWTGDGSITLAKTTTAGQYFRGAQGISATDSGGGNEYFYQRFNGVAGDEYFVWAASASDVTNPTTCKLQAYDVTGGAEIKAETHAQTAWQGLGFSFTLPSSCTRFDIRGINVTASGVSYWDQVQLLRKNSVRYDLPTWVTETWQVGRTVYQLEGATFVGDGTMPDESGGKLWPFIRVKKELALVYVVPQPSFGNDNPIYIECLRPYAALSADSSSTNADLDWVAAKTKYECLRMLAAPLVPTEERGEFRNALEEAKMEAAAQDARFMPKVEQRFGFGDEVPFALEVT